MHVLIQNSRHPRYELPEIRVFHVAGLQLTQDFAPDTRKKNLVTNLKILHIQVHADQPVGGADDDDSSDVDEDLLLMLNNKNIFLYIFVIYF